MDQLSHALDDDLATALLLDRRPKSRFQPSCLGNDHDQNSPPIDRQSKASAIGFCQPIRRQFCDNNNSNPDSSASYTYKSRLVGSSSATHKNPSQNRDNEILNQVKKRLSLPHDISIPASFLMKQQQVGIGEPPNRQRSLAGGLLLPQSSVAQKEQPPLSRFERRRSLLEIGFGQSSTYTKLDILGSGTYSIVYKGTSRLTKKLVALKEIHLEREEGAPFTAIREVSLLKELKHNNIITLHDIIYTNDTLTLVFEYVTHDLGRYMDKCDHKINIDNVRLFLYQLLRALKYCHDRRILHRDIKPQNILISSGGELKLADFGLARAKSVPTKTFTDEVVTLWYRPPDVLLGNVEYGTSIDMWGVGCIFFEMAAGHSLFTGYDPKKQIESIFEIIGTPDKNDWPSIESDLISCSLDIPYYSGRDLASLAPRLDGSGIDLLAKFLKCNPKSRISSNEAMRHQYFSSLPPEIHELPNSASVFSIPSIKLSQENSRSLLNSMCD